MPARGQSWILTEHRLLYMYYRNKSPGLQPAAGILKGGNSSSHDLRSLCCNGKDTDRYQLQDGFQSGGVNGLPWVKISPLPWQMFFFLFVDLE